MDLPVHCFTKHPNDREEVQQVKDVFSLEKWELRAPVIRIQGWIDGANGEVVYFPLNGFLPVMPEVLKQCLRDPYPDAIQGLYARVDVASLRHVLSGVRNRLQDMVLALRKEVPDFLEEVELSPRSDQAAQAREVLQVFVNVSQDVRVEQNLNLGSLIADLRNYGVDPGDLARLRKVVQEEGKRGVIRWLGSVVDKLSDKVLDHAIQAVLRYVLGP